jgi:hypothetical protein
MALLHLLQLGWAAAAGRTSGAGAGAAPENKGAKRRIMLWSGHPCETTYPWPAENCTDELINTMLSKLEPYKDVVDTIGLVTAYYVADPANASMAGFNSGLVRHANVHKVITAYKARGWAVEPIVGDIDPTLTRPGQIQQARMKIENYRPYLRPGKKYSHRQM